MAYVGLVETAEVGGGAGNGGPSGDSKEKVLEDIELNVPAGHAQDEKKLDYDTSPADEIKSSEAGDVTITKDGDGEEGEGGEKDEKGGKKKKRDVWDNRFQFILTLVGFAVGLGNVWRFSFLVARNGGSAFLVPYTIMLFVLGIPLFYMELTFGQSIRRGAVMAWYAISPNLVGIGIASFVINAFISVYYCVIIAWVFFFLYHSFRGRLPWGICFDAYVPEYDNRWQDYLEKVRNDSRFTNTSLTQLFSCYNRSTEYFWYNNAVEASDDIGVAARFNWEMALWLLLAWVVVYLCLFKGIQSSGKIVYFTATFPYVVLICFFFRAVTLVGAGDGLRYLFLPAGGAAWFAQAFSPQVWLEAATQIFFSLGLSLGVLIALASYTTPRYNTLVDSFIVCLTNSVTSIFSSIIVFSIVGFRAHQLDVTPELLSTGPGLAFIVFTEALLHMPGAPFWAVLFFIMLLLLGLDSQFATLEGIITVIRDIKIFKKIRKELLIAIICLIFYLVTFPFVLGNGVYLFELFDQFAGTLPLLLIGLAEYIALAWVFGVSRFFSDLAKPVSRRLKITWIVMWKWVGPIVMLVIFLASVINELIQPLEYSVYVNFAEIKEVYPSWAQFVGAVIVLMAILPIPIVLIGRLILYQSAREEALAFFTGLRTDAENVVRVIVTWRYRRRHGSWSPRQPIDHDLDNLYEHAETPYQWELGDVGTSVNDSTKVTIKSSNSVGFTKVKENGINS